MSIGFGGRDVLGGIEGASYMVVGSGKCERRGNEDGVETTLLRRLAEKRKWLEWECVVRGLDN